MVCFSVQPMPVIFFFPIPNRFILFCSGSNAAPVGIGPHAGTITRPKSVMARLDSTTCSTRELAFPLHYIRKEQAFVDFELPA